MRDSHYDQQPAKHATRGYKASVRAWIRRLRHEDGRQSHEQDFRSRMLGNLATGGKAGLAPGAPIVPHPSEDTHFPQPKEP